MPDDDLITDIRCRFCGSGHGEIVLDAGRQPTAKVFPKAGDPAEDPLHPLRMWMCGRCHLAQLVEDPDTTEEEPGLEPDALVQQAEDAVARMAAAGIVGEGTVLVEFGSPHGGSWWDILARYGARAPEPGELADVVVDNLGYMHDADQAAALERRTSLLKPDGVVLFQFHTLASIVAGGQWNALRHGHFAYYSTPALAGMLESAGWTPTTAWWFPLYGGSVLLAARREGVRDQALSDLIASEDAAGMLKADIVRGLQRAADDMSDGLRQFIESERAAGRTVWGYSAASRAVALLCRAGVGPELLPSIADGGGAKHGRRMPGSGVPITAPDEMVAARPDTVLLFVADLLPEVRRALPEIEADGGRWVIADELHAS
ncbi:class I SAM-dependent methyltransferase [Pseudonocardia sp. KRD291]|uniref:class I SAM-dependent methyltransferase n=1 Tax=Pseudonocardia sp. KRD291 TaxID=2792007 RepID=UPI001C49D65F|nr:class I SAM-dependent methyltransferase [Pseudonocardia sp. KRD291]MBW0101564.1 methyltransferase domain-containing protein [Pseudonocardia sp. KRD291]